MYQYWFVWWMRVCVLFLCLEDMFKPTATASHSHRRKVQLRRQWDGTEDNSPITPSLLHKTHTDDMECIDHSYWREITVHHLIIIITRFFLPIFFVKVLRRYWQSLLELLWLFEWRSAGSFQVWQCALCSVPGHQTLVAIYSSSQNLLENWSTEINIFLNFSGLHISPQNASLILLKYQIV